MYVGMVTITVKYELISLDVVSLFSNIPVELAMSVERKRLVEMDLSNNTPLTVEGLISLLNE